MMLPRWDPVINNKEDFLKKLKFVLSDVCVESSGRGRRPKHSKKEYLMLLLLKEFKRASLREAEVDCSNQVCGERVDHSVIHYWEKTLDRRLIQRLVEKLGGLLKNCLPADFHAVDSTRFAS